MARTKKPIRNKKKRTNKRKLYRPQRGLNPAIMSFKRSRTTVVELNNLAGAGWVPSTGGGIARSWSFALSDLNDISDFTNLFRYYKIKAVRVQMYFSNNMAPSRDGSTFANNQLLIYTDINQDGITTGVADELYYLDSQTAKKRIAIQNSRRPSLDMLMRMKQSNQIYAPAASGGADYTLQSPKWISTTEVSTPHFGQNMLIERVDGHNLSTGSSNYQYVKFIYTYYIQCKKVQ